MSDPFATLPSSERRQLVLRLRPRLAAATEGERVEAELRRGGEVLFRAEVDGSRLTLPSDLESVTFTYSEPHVELPRELAEELAVLEALDGVASDAPLWLEFPSPSGLLPIVPWERLLGSVDACRERPVLRLPYRPQSRVDTTRPPERRPRRVLLCASSPRAKQALGLAEMTVELATTLAHVLAEGSEVHLFPQARTEEPAEDVVARLERWLAEADDPVRRTVHLHDPRGRDFTAPPRSRSPHGSETPSPWLTWMSEELGGRAADAVHFVAHGYRNGSEGALALAETPTDDRDRRFARFLWSRELLPFLDRVGAWMVGFTSPSPNFSILGLRLLADRLARERSGAVLLDEGLIPNEGAGRAGLEAAWARLLGGVEGPLPRSPGLRLQVDPVRLVEPRLAFPRLDAGVFDRLPPSASPPDGLDFPEEVAEPSEPEEPESPSALDLPAEGEYPVEAAEDDSGWEPPGERRQRQATEPKGSREEGKETGGPPSAPSDSPEAPAPASPPAPPPVAGQAPAEPPRWWRVQQRAVENVLSFDASPGAGDDPLSAARRRGVQDAVALVEELLADGPAPDDGEER